MKKSWFAISKDVYVSLHAKEKILLYHTKNGHSFITSNAHHIRLINEVYNSVNLGVVDLEIYPDINDDVLDFIDKITSLEIGKVIEKTTEDKPLNFLPILNLQNDIERLKQTNQEYLIGDNISQYLNSVSIIINNQCGQKCENCDIFYKQFPSCSKFFDEPFMPFEAVKNIIVQSSYLQVRRINILGGDITLYPQWNELLDFLKEYDFSYHLWFNLSQIQDVNSLISLPFHKEINVPAPYDKDILLKILKQTSAKTDFTFHFVIENLQHFEAVNNIVNDYNVDNYKIVPLYNKDNIGFFEENVFLNEADILSETIEMRKIFCNQKLNSNFFGALYFLPNGEVKANMNSRTIGKFPDHSILQLIYMELMDNTAWRKIRENGKCTKCIYRYLCPPVSNYELVLEKFDLCTCG